MSAPRFPAVALAKGHYESYYLRAADPAGGRSAWIRHTVFKRPGGPVTGALWCTLFEAGKPPRAVKQSLPDPRAGDWLTIGDSHFGPRGAKGRAEALGHSAAWDLSFGPSSAPLRHLPHPRLYDAPLPRTKTESPLPDTTISGRVEDWELDAWPGMVGHNWGAEHAERWIWLHGTGFDGAPDAWLDVALGRIKVGRFTTPWIANGALHLDGERIRVGGLGRRARVAERAGRRPHRGQRPHDRRPRRPARLVDLLRPLGRRAPQHELLDRVPRPHRRRPHAAHRSTAAPGSSARARRRSASRSSPSRTPSDAEAARGGRRALADVLVEPADDRRRRLPHAAGQARAPDRARSRRRPAAPSRRSAACAAAARSAGGRAGSRAARS